mmetsp:Transcript_35461/g.141239  ORF Transcript_35461/g.141239 Transcript_35461/m.141239 type:complete len:279 (-) Transcript_35461:3-839(-)
MIPFGKSFTVSAVFLPSVQVVVIVFPLGIVVQCPVGNGQILHGLLTSGQLALVRVKHLREGVVVLPQLFRTCVLWNMENAVMVRCVDDSFNLLFHGPRPLSVIHWCCCWLVIGYVSFPYPSSRFWDGLWIGSRGIDVELSILLSNNIINDCSHLKSLPLPVHQVLIGWTALESFFKRSHRLLVLLSLDFRCTLSPVPLGPLRSQLDAHISIVFCFLELLNLRVCRSPTKNFRQPAIKSRSAQLTILPLDFPIGPKKKKKRKPVKRSVGRAAHRFFTCC